MNNPIEMIRSFIGKGKNPQDIIKNSINKNNPIFGNLINMAQSGNLKGVEEFARNFLKEQGRDFDKEFSEFMSNFK